MTQEKNMDLTPEEQAEFAENLPQLLEGLSQGKPAAIAWLAHLRSERNMTEEAKAQAEVIRQEVATAPSEQGTLAQWCGFPTDMTRCSPFFPMNPNDLGQRLYLENYLITSANWGEIRYTGPQLSTYEEDVLLALLAILDSQSQYRKKSYVLEGYDDENKKNLEFVHITDNMQSIPENIQDAFEISLSYKGPILPLLKILGIQKPGKTNYNRLLSALKRLTVGGVELSISTGKTKSGKRRAPRITQMAAMLAGVYWDSEKKILTATVNPFFYETYLAGRVTLMDVAKRMKLKGAIAKALYRFVQSQRQNPVFVGHFLTLADSLNMDREQPAKKTRQLLKTAISELTRHGILMRKSGFVEQDIIKLNRTAEALPPTEKKNLKKC